jgi:hypothetical protein
MVSARKTAVFIRSALSGVATDLPSEKSLKSGGTVLNPQLDCFARHSGTEMARPPSVFEPLSPEIYSLSGLVGAAISYWDSTTNRHA